MSRDTIYLGPVPADEECAQLGEPGYEEAATAQCRRYIDRIRAILGLEPPGAALRARWQAHDFGRYLEVVCEYDPDDERAAEYAFLCDSEGPTTWEDEDA